MKNEAKARKHREHRYAWLAEPLAAEPSLISKPMFGCEGYYLHGRLVLVLTSQRQEPWRGVMIPTERVHHTALKRQFNGVRVHPVLKKWLYLPESCDCFEETARLIVRCILARDNRIGVDPS